MKLTHVRRKTLRTAAVAIVMSALCSEGNVIEKGPHDRALTPDEVIELLTGGNARFVKGTRSYPSQEALRRAEVSSKGQHPYVTLVSCSDSRVPPEHIFDAGIGDLFVVRVAGNVCDTDEIATVEYGAGHLGTPLVMVLGHSKCGAVTAVVKGEKVHGHLPALVDNITPAAKKAAREKGSAFSEGLLDAAIENNVWQSIEDLLTRSRDVAELVKGGKVRVVGALYDLDTGEVKIMGEHPAQKELLAKGAGEGHGGGRPMHLLWAFITAAAVTLLSHLLFINASSRIKALQIQGRLRAGGLSVIAVFASSLSVALFTAGGAATLDTLSLALLIGIPCLASAVLLVLHEKSVIGSFRAVINSLKQGSGTG